MAEFFQIFRTESTVDDTMVAAHRDRHAMADNDLVAIVDHLNCCDPADRENESLRRINDSGKTVDAHATKIRNGECAALKFFRLHPLVACAMRQILGQFADLTQRFVLGSPNDWRQ